MSEQLNCRLCGGRHKARSDKLPMRLENKQNEQLGAVCKKCRKKADKIDAKKRRELR